MGEIVTANNPSGGEAAMRQAHGFVKKRKGARRHPLLVALVSNWLTENL